MLEMVFHTAEPRPMALVAKKELASVNAEVPAAQVASMALVTLSKMTPPPEMAPWPIEAIPVVLADHEAPRVLVRPPQITSHPETVPLPTAHNPDERP